MITFDQFKKHILKEKETMENLLEKEFVIENCTLSQRLAIKAYCDEKKIEYAGEELFLTTNYSHICYLLDREKQRFSGHNSNKLFGGKTLKIITFLELIQFLDQYQPEPEFKVGDFIYFNGSHYKAGPYLLKEKISDGIFKDSNNETRNIKQSEGAYRHATPEEIKKWKEENEIKLPRIADYDGLVVGRLEKNQDSLKWGCTEISISTVKELLKLNLRDITLNGYNIDQTKVQQIKKFIEHNKL